MNPAEIVVKEMQGQRRSQVRPLFGESVGEPRQSPHPHPHSEIAPLDKRSGYFAELGHSTHKQASNRDYIAGTVAFLPGS